MKTKKRACRRLSSGGGGSIIPLLVDSRSWGTRQSRNHRHNRLLGITDLVNGDFFWWNPFINSVPALKIVRNVAHAAVRMPCLASLDCVRQYNAGYNHYLRFYQYGLHRRVCFICMFLYKYWCCTTFKNSFCSCDYLIFLFQPQPGLIRVGCGVLMNL